MVAGRHPTSTKNRKSPPTKEQNKTQLQQKNAKRERQPTLLELANPPDKIMRKGLNPEENPENSKENPNNQRSKEQLDKNNPNEQRSKEQLEKNNPYGILNDNEENGNAQNQATHKPATNQETTTKRTAPIIAVGTNVSAVSNILKEAIKDGKYELKMTSTGIRINTLNSEAYNAATQALKDNNVGYFQYHTAETRPRKIVLFGLPTMETTEVTKLLNDAKVYPIDVKMMMTRKSRASGDAVFILYFAPGTTNLNKLREIKHLDQIIIRFEAYQPRGRDHVARCRRCQMYGHSSINCNLPPACMVCAEAHPTEQCGKKVPRETLKASKTKPDCSFVKCANCNGNHTSSYKGCPKRKEFIRIQEKISNKNQPERKHQSKPPPQFDDEKSFPRPPWQRQKTAPNEGTRPHSTWNFDSNPSAQQTNTYLPNINGLETVIQTMVTMQQQMQSTMLQLIELVSTLAAQKSTHTNQP